jgi:NTP pyrophosphatase (non-canonical NTP hydrolase)
MTEDIKKIYQEAIDKWGFNPQLNQLQEECAELIVACNKLRRKGDEAVPMMVDELTDVIIMTEQIIQVMQIEKEVDERYKFKIERLKERLEK